MSELLLTNGEEPSDCESLRGSIREIAVVLFNIHSKKKAWPEELATTQGWSERATGKKETSKK